LAIVGTTTGGSGEILRNRETAMTFLTGDSVDCARAIRDLFADQSLFDHIRTNAQREVTEHYTLDAMIDLVEAALKSIATFRTATDDAR